MLEIHLLLGFFFVFGKLIGNKYLNTFQTVVTYNYPKVYKMLYEI